MKVSGKESLKEFLGEIPFTAELYWLLRQRGKPIRSRFSLKHLQAALPEAAAQALPFAQAAPKGRKVFIFATLHYWIEHAAMLGVALAGQGHHVTLGYLPYGEWQNAHQSLRPAPPELVRQAGIEPGFAPHPGGSFPGPALFGGHFAARAGERHR